MIASFGKVTFKVTDKEIKIFNDLSISKSARFATHERVNNKPLLQFMGLNAESITFTMQLIENVTGSISKDLKELNKMLSSGTPYAFFLGTKKIGNFVLESLSENYNIINNLGHIEMVTLNLSLKEYV